MEQIRGEQVACFPSINIRVREIERQLWKSFVVSMEKGGRQGENNSYGGNFSPAPFEKAAWESAKKEEQIKVVPDFQQEGKSARSQNAILFLQGRHDLSICYSS